jgi:hypothetical protein
VGTENLASVNEVFAEVGAGNFSIIIFTSVQLGFGFFSFASAFVGLPSRLVQGLQNKFSIIAHLCNHVP